MDDSRSPNRSEPAAAPRSTTATALRLLVMSVSWAGVALQLADSISLSLANGSGIAQGLIVYFGYFTILTNLLVAIVVSSPRLRSRPVLAATATAAIIVVAITYVLLLRATWNPQGLGAVANVLLHYVTPAATVAWWLVAAPKRTLQFTDVLKMLVYPVAYCVYALVRGELTGLYPYPFADVSALGYPRAMLNTSGVLVAFALVAGVLVGVRRASARTAPA